jgi:hypothetical protein
LPEYSVFLGYSPGAADLSLTIGVAVIDEAEIDKAEIDEAEIDKAED